MSIAFNSLRNIFVRSFTVVFLLTISVLTARLLGPEGSGVYALVALYSSIGVAALGGMGAAAGRWIANLRRPVPEVVANITALALVAGTAALALLIAIYWLAGLIAGARPEWLLYVGAAQPALLLASALTWAFLGADDHGNYSWAILAPSACTLLLMGPLLLAGGDTETALLGWLAAQYAVIGWLWWRGRAVWTPLPLGAVTLSSMGAIAVFSVMTGLANLVSILNYRADMLLVEHFLGTAGTGIYSKAVQLVEGLFFISQAVGVAILPRVGAAAHDDAAALVARSIRITLALMLAAGLLLCAVAGLLIPLLFGADFAGAVTPFRIFIPGVAAWGMANLLATFYTTHLGRPRVPLLTALWSLGITVLSSLVLIPLWGLSGAALATTLGYVAAIAGGLWLFRRDTGTPWRALLLPDSADLRDGRTLAGKALALLWGRRQPPEAAPALEPEAAEPLFRRIRAGELADRGTHPAGERSR